MHERVESLQLQAPPEKAEVPTNNRDCQYSWAPPAPINDRVAGSASRWTTKSQWDWCNVGMCLPGAEMVRTSTLSL